MSGALTLLFALSGGVVVGNLYWAQPLLDDIGAGLSVPAGLAGLIITGVQVGYALGALLIVPLGDTLARHRLIPAIMAVSVLALVVTAVAPSYAVVVLAMFVVGLSSVTGQLLTPLAGDLARPEHRGRTIGTVASGLLFGILIARVVSGFVADLAGWRSVFVFAAVLNLVFALLLARSIPRMPASARVGYGTLLRSVFVAVRESARLRVLILLGACVMAVFTMFWTGLTFLLSSAPYGFSVTRIGLVSLLGVAGAVAAQNVGRLFDRGWALPAIGAGFALTLLSMVAAAFAGGGLAVVFLAAAVSSVGIQSVLVLVQTSVMAIDPKARSRLNTALIVGNFIGGAIGSTLTAVLWDTVGWPLTSGAAGVVALVGLVVWAAQRRRALA
ncbi:MFS transporter [Nocardiopsis metallicus]|uniref:Putative MFS family arabinose efflux permease n=1 Tax=Nocardiopsis metallicus TaxID=179819 RepID=A0A840WNS6_9ACTN|nr:MFS transporter [Nocardiopsis metallicus]MBB5493257.1 putative MFS family arabinose efflux permease [Nocardiopsis metallicus]